jgi:hypothetical protein
MTAGEFVLEAARPWLTTSQGERIAQFLEDSGPHLDWDDVLESSARLRVAPVVWWNLRLGPWRVPQVARQYLRAMYLYHRRRNALLLREAARILHELARVGIVPIVRKGIYLAHVVYPDPGMRQMNDIDLFVSREEAKRTVLVLEALGYESGRLGDDARSIEPETRERRAFWRLYTNNLPTMRRLVDDEYVSHLAVDLTVNLFLPATGYDVSPEQLTAGAETCELAGERARVLAPEPFLLDICAHIHKESSTLRYIAIGGHQRLIQHCDILALVTHPVTRLDWGRFLELVDLHGVDSPCYFALGHTAQLFSDVVPHSVLATLSKRAGKMTAYLDEFGSIDGEPRRTWRTNLRDRVFARELPADLPASRSLT